MYKTLYIIYSQYKAKTPYQTAKYKISDSQITKPKNPPKTLVTKKKPQKQKKIKNHIMTLHLLNKFMYINSQPENIIEREYKTNT